jgi:2-amino-4-hydroxy-6-hydroxymethyldihydropteridine diphosphokinase
MEEMKRFAAFVALGSNVGDREKNLKTAVEKLETKNNKVVLKSNIYKTEPYGEVKQDDFYNAVVGILTPFQPLALLNVLKTIEIEMGRTKTEKWGPRVIDLDIIMYGEYVIDDKDLKIPHPDFRNREFVLKPMTEIGRMMVDPVTEKTVAELYTELNQNKAVKVGTL